TGQDLGPSVPAAGAAACLCACAPFRGGADGAAGRRVAQQAGAFAAALYSATCRLRPLQIQKISRNIGYFCFQSCQEEIGTLRAEAPVSHVVAARRLQLSAAEPVERRCGLAAGSSNR